MIPRTRPKRPIDELLRDVSPELLARLADCCSRRGTTLERAYAHGGRSADREARSACYAYLISVEGWSCEEIGRLFDRRAETVRHAVRGRPWLPQPPGQGEPLEDLVRRRRALVGLESRARAAEHPGPATLSEILKTKRRWVVEDDEPQYGSRAEAPEED